MQPKRKLVKGAIGISVQARMAAKPTKGTPGGLVLGGWDRGERNEAAEADSQRERAWSK